MYILATSSNWFSKLVRQFFFLLDSIIYGAISKIYDLLITIARTSPLSQADILDMADRIYKLLAIFMVFKVTFSLIMYVVNPDDFSDKNKGVSKLGMNIVVSLSMLILTPYIFSYAYQLQTYILEDNSLATLIFGTSTKKEFFNTAGDDMAYMAMSPFFVPDDSFHELNACSNLTIEEGTGNDKRIVFNPECSGLNNDSDLTAKGGEYETTTSLLKFTKDNNQFTVDNLRVYVKGVNSKNVGLTFRQELATATDPETKEFIMDYSFIFSSVVGVIIVLLLVTYCMDIALRSIKLAFLQLIAPIPIISYVDPKSGKDGLFKKWYQMCFKTYLSLFIRLIALYFAVYIISRVSEMHLVDVIDGSFQTNAFVAIFIIIGALMFAKQLPKILEGLGVKLDGGGFTLNPLRKMEKDMLGGKLMKKPADFVGHLPMAPINSLSTLGKKTIGGIDAARNGKGFKQGWNRTHGKLHNNFYKKLDEWAPDSAEARKNERLGKEEISLMHNKWAKGDKVMENLGGNFDSLDGLNEEAYSKAGFNGRFLTSKMNLDKATEQQKILNRIYQARQMGTSLPEAIADERANIDKYGLDASKFSTDTDLYKMVDSTNKKVSGMEKVHESLRKTDQGQAALEDAIKFRKYNPEDPTNVTQSTPPTPVTQQYSAPSNPTPAQSSNSSSENDAMQRVLDSTGQTHMENRERNDWEKESAFATTSDSDFNEYQRLAREKNSESSTTTTPTSSNSDDEINRRKRQIESEIQKLQQIHDSTTNRDVMVNTARQIRILEEELRKLK